MPIGRAGNVFRAVRDGRLNLSPWLGRMGEKAMGVVGGWSTLMKQRGHGEDARTGLSHALLGQINGGAEFR